MKVGDKVKLLTPGNRRLDGTSATVTKVTPWGAYTAAPAAATGEYRALFAEMKPIPSEYTGDACDLCGSVRMRQAGMCKVCEDCGESGGCG